MGEDMRNAIYSVHILEANMSPRMIQTYETSAALQAAYAQRCRTDLILKTSKTISDTPWASSQRMEMEKLFDTYDRILYVDADVLIKPDAPNIFEAINDSYIHMLPENSYNKNYIEKEVIPYIQQVKPSYKASKYYNAGVMLLNREHRKAIEFVHDEYFESFRFEQDYINYRIDKFNMQVIDLSIKWNAILLYEKSEDYLKNNYFTFVPSNSI